MSHTHTHTRRFYSRHRRFLSSHRRIRSRRRCLSRRRRRYYRENRCHDGIRRRWEKYVHVYVVAVVVVFYEREIHCNTHTHTYIHIYTIVLGCSFNMGCVWTAHWLQLKLPWPLWKRRQSEFACVSRVQQPNRNSTIQTVPLFCKF